MERRISESRCDAADIKLKNDDEYGFESLARLFERIPQNQPKEGRVSGCVDPDREGFPAGVFIDRFQIDPDWGKMCYFLFLDELS